MGIESITFEDLMQECQISDPVEFRRILRRNSLPVFSSAKLIDRSTASLIVKRLQGRKIDWYKYEARERDQVEAGPLERKSHAGHGQRIEAWYQQLFQGRQPSLGDGNSILGLATRGGFLEGQQGGDFILSLDPHINVFIGDRGSGKSTALNLLGLLADSVTEETNTLVTSLLNLLEKTPRETATIRRRARKILREYGVDNYCVFFTQEGANCCCSVDFPDKSIDLLQRGENGWVSAPDTVSFSGPSMQVLQQGEVIAIADEKNRFFLHNILDGLYPDLREKRSAFAEETKKLITQLEYFGQTRVETRGHALRRFLEQTEKELALLRNDWRQKLLTDRGLQILKGYLKRYSEIDKSSLPGTLFEMLQGDSTSLYYLYLGRTRGFFSYAVNKIEKLQKAQLGMLADLIESRASSGGESGGAEPSFEAFFKDMSAEADDLTDEESTTESAPPSSPESNLMRESLKLDSESASGAEMYNLLGRIVYFLGTRQDFLNRCERIFFKERVACDEKLMALNLSYINLLQQRIALILTQQEKCIALAKNLNKDELEIGITTRSANRLVERHNKSIRLFSLLESNYRQLSIAAARSSLRVLSRCANDYDDGTRELLDGVKDLRSSDGAESELLFCPIDVTLRQGNTYRDFHQLSFGQKSGIILKMVLATTDKPIILIDQPEDNLDASSVVNMLAPTLNRLGEDRQIVIVTHNSQLVMGLTEPRVLVLGSLGEHGRLREEGLPLGSQQLVQDMLDVLEGGLEAFNQKLKTYDQFLSRVTGSIEDIDITAIESSFRRRTIDGLRNFLQPIVSDRSLMEFLRHQLKQPDYAGIKKDIENTIQEIKSAKDSSGAADSKVLSNLSRLCERLDSHIEKLRSAIEEIRLLDTHPRPEMVNLYDLLAELRDEYVGKISRARQIRIEVSPALRGCVAFVDPDHLRLVFRNLFSNALRATEKRVVQEMTLACGEVKPEVIQIDGFGKSDSFFTVLFEDNGCGMTAEFSQKLYVERCSDQKGRDHGLGGVIIRKLLDLSGGAIRILTTKQDCRESGTMQEITLPVGNDQLSATAKLT